ncbi:MAG: hypothetical protein KF819_18765 [Labilithrix sp.]|nr:hypothetical protein [Labilithrix sp.]
MTTSLANDAHDVAPDSQFESYFDADSGVWSLRRIPSTPPEVDEPHVEMDEAPKP